MKSPMELKNLDDDVQLSGGVDRSYQQILLFHKMITAYSFEITKQKVPECCFLEIFAKIWPPWAISEACFIEICNLQLGCKPISN